MYVVSPPTLRKRRGTTLVELIIACVCLVSISTAALTALSYTGKRSSGSVARTIALQAAASEIESARSTGFVAGLSAGTATTVRSLPGILAPATVAKTVSPVPGTTNLFKVTVIVSWQAGSPDSLSLETLVRNGGAS